MPRLRQLTLLSLLTASALLVACSRPASAPEPVRSVRLQRVGEQGSTPGRSYAAEVRARQEVALAFRVAGRVEQRAVDNGQAVRAGQALATLDATDYQLGQRAAEAAQQAARTSLEQAESDLRRNQELRAQGFIGPAELERRENAARAARAQWEQAKAAAAGQGRQTSYTTLSAPANGVITAVLAEPGQVVAAGAPVLRLAEDGPRDVVFSVPESQVAAVRGLRGRAGAVTVQLWGQAEGFPATVREVAAAADATTRTFQVKADLGGRAVQLGQTASVIVPLAETVTGFALPLTAVVAQGAGSAVWLFDRAQGRVRQQPVVLGAADGNQVVVVQGLKAGDEVVTAGTHVLTPGQTVRPWQPPNAAAAASDAQPQGARP